MDQCKALIHSAACYHALDQLAAAAKSVIKLVQLAVTLSPADCLSGDVQAAYAFVKESIAKLTKLHVFLDSTSLASPPPGMEELSCDERQIIHRAVTSAVEMMLSEVVGFWESIVCPLVQATMEGNGEFLLD